MRLYHINSQNLLIFFVSKTKHFQLKWYSFEINFTNLRLEPYAGYVRSRHHKGHFTKWCVKKWIAALMNSLISWDNKSKKFMDNNQILPRYILMCKMGLMIMQICFYLFQVKRCCSSTHHASKHLRKEKKEPQTWQQETISAHLHVSKQQRGN